MFSSRKSAAPAAGGYTIAKSLRFRKSASAYLNRTPASAGNRKTWTWSGWVKLGLIGNESHLFAAYKGSGTVDNEFLSLFFDNNNLKSVGYSTTYLTTTQVFRDPSAWYHIVWTLDTTSATANNRMRIYVNGSEITAFSTRNNPSQNADLGINQAALHQIGQNAGFGQYLDGYLAEVNFIDGQALTPTSFGATDAATGVWQPIAYTGTYGTNGFYLKFTDTTSTTTLGNDSSGNANNWTTNNISLTSGSTYDSMKDVPTLTDADTANYCVGNPLSVGANTSLSNANLSGTLTGSGGWAGTIGGLTSGKWYWEATPTANSGNSMWVGFLSDAYTKNDNGWSYSTQIALYANDARNGNNASYGASWTTNDVIGIALDLSSSSGSITFYKNGVSQGVMFSSLTSSAIWRPFVSGGGTGTTIAMNFGQRPFSYTPPSGYVALNTFNLPTPTIGATASTQANDYFDVTTYTGTGSSQSITNSGSMQPDFVWIKGRSGATDHALYDAVRGVQKQLESNTTTDETTESTGLTAFNSDGFTVGSLAQVNTNTDTYVAWNWKESATSGFDIVTYTGNGTARTISHNLGVAPDMIIVKAITTAGTDQGWPVYHSANTANPETDYLLLNTTAATADLDTVWNDTNPTSSVFSVGTNALVNTNNDTYVAYLFAEVAGYSSFGSYTGNGSTDGPFIYTGFRPRFYLYKRTDTTASWIILDAQRNTSNIVTNILAPDLANAESSFDMVDFCSNGIKIRNNFNADNGNGGTFIYAAFAENPFKYSLAR